MSVLFKDGVHICGHQMFQVLMAALQTCQCELFLQVSKGSCCMFCWSTAYCVLECLVFVHLQARQSRLQLKLQLQVVLGYM